MRCKIRNQALELIPESSEDIYRLFQYDQCSEEEYKDDNRNHNCYVRHRTLELFSNKK